MLGAIAGDVIGSIYEGTGFKAKAFPLFDPKCRFTDDTVLSVAVADCILHGKDYADAFHEYFNNYPWSGYGKTFLRWAGRKSRKPYNSWANGSAMRVSPVGFAYDTIEEVLDEAQRSAEVTHNHPEGIKGAQATAAAIFLARTGQDKAGIKDYIEQTFAYNLSERLDDIRPGYKFDVSCQGSVPQAIVAFLESTDYEDAVRNAISLGGDADTMACIAGGIAQAHYGGVPDHIRDQTLSILEDHLCSVTEAFMAKYGK